MTNKTPGQVTELFTSIKFIRETLGVTELSEECLRIIYNFAYTHFKYMNSSVTHLSTGDKKNRAKATEDPWVYVMTRVNDDRLANRDYTVIKGRFIDLVNSGQNYLPLDK